VTVYTPPPLRDVRRISSDDQYKELKYSFSPVDSYMQRVLAAVSRSFPSHFPPPDVDKWNPLRRLVEYLDK